MKPLKFILTALGINLFLFLLVYIIPLNILREIIGYLTSFFVFIFGFGLKLGVDSSRNLVILSTAGGKLELYQTFYEIITIISLTIPLYFDSFKKMIEKLILIFAIMIGYYVLLYGITILLLENGFKVFGLLSFIRFNTESFMIFAFGLVWFFVNKEKIKSYFLISFTQK